MAITINGTGSITGLTAGGLPDGSVTAADIETSLDLTGKTVTLPSGTGGKILQVVQTIKTNIFTTTSSSFVDVPGLSASITPSSSSNKILCVVNIGVGTSSGGADNKVQVLRGSTEIVPNDVLVRTDSTSICQNWNISVLDSPATTSSTTYKVQILSESTFTVKVNSRDYEADLDGISTITLMEVAA